MADKKFILPDTETVSMSGRAAELLLGCGCPEAALLYIYMLKTGGEIGQDAEKTLKISDDRIKHALSVLCRLGLCRDAGLAGDKMPDAEKSGAESVPAANGRETAGKTAARRPESADMTPEYSIADIRREISNGAQFSMLVNEVQRALGKIMSSDDLIKLFGIYDSIGMPPEVILQLVTYCIAENRRKYGDDRMPTMRYIEKAAYTWEREGVMSLERAEEYIRRAEIKRDKQAELARALSIRGRELTATEKRYIGEWIDMGFESDAVSEAYDRTVTKTGRLVWKYMDSILKNWHGRGAHTMEDIEKLDPRAGKEKQRASTSGDGYGGPTAADIERMKKTLENIKNN